MKQRSIFGFPQNVFILSLVSLLNDIGGQTIKYTIPLFLSNVLGVKTSIIGLVEGIAEATPQLLQPISGLISDKLQKRKTLVLIGQVARSSIIFLFFATSWPLVLFIRFLDRTGKGIQMAPRDALVSLSSDKNKQGRSFGLSRALDNTGAIIGLIMAGLITILAGKGLLTLSYSVFKSIVLLAIIPSMIAVILILIFVKDISGGQKVKQFLQFKDHLDKKFYRFLLIIFIFTLGNSSDAFLILKAQKVGLSISSIFFLLAGFSLTAALVSLPIGIISDKIGRKANIILGWLLYAFVYFGFAHATTSNTIIILFLLYGLYYGLTEGVMKAYVADIIPAQKKGFAFGIYNLVIGGTLFPASLLAGFLWQTFSPTVAFYFGGILAIVATVGFLLLK